MRTFKLVALFVLFLLGGQQSFHNNNLAYARHNADHCCMCTTGCKTWCWCSGQANCRRCHVDDSDTLLSPVSADNLTIDLRRTTQLRPGKFVISDSVEKIITLMDARRLRVDFTLKLIDHVDDHMKFKCMRLES
jgi:hypothetical protein